jgi:hypothetical protein
MTEDPPLISGPKYPTDTGEKGEYNGAIHQLF